MDFPKEEYEHRWKKVYAEMSNRGYTTLVVWQRSGGSYDRAGHVWWLASYASQQSGQRAQRLWSEAGYAFAALILHDGQEPELHINEPLDVVDLSRIPVANVKYHDNLFLGVADRIRELRVERVAYVGDDVLPATHYRALIAASPGVVWVPDDPMLTLPELVKSPLELDAFREAGDISSRALTALMEALIQGRPESEAAAKAAEIVVAAGGGIHRVATNHGLLSETTAWSDALVGYTTQAPEPGELVIACVFGPIAKGYWVDPCRTAFCGRKATREQREAIESCLEIVDEAVNAVRVGTTPREAAAKVDVVARRVGYFSEAPPQWPYYGHGLHMFFDAPYLVPLLEPGAKSVTHFVDEPFRNGQVFTGEAFLHRPGIGTASFEEVFIVTDEGPEILSTTPRVFW